MKIKSLYELLIAESETSGLHTSSGGGGSERLSQILWVQKLLSLDRKRTKYFQNQI